MKRGIFIGLVVALAALASIGAVVANNAQQPTYDIRMIVAHDPAPPYYIQAMKHFADVVENETNGHVRVQVLTGRQYGTIEMATLRNALMDGKFEMSASTVSSLGYVSKDFWAFELPYMFDNYAQVARTIDGPVGKHLMAELPSRGLRGLAYSYSGGFKVICSNDKPYATPSDFRGATVLAHDPVNVSFYKSLGANVKVGIYRESKALMAQHKINAAEMTLTRYKEYGLKCKYVTELDHSFFLTTILINENFYQKLPAAYREIIANAAQDAALSEREQTVREIQSISKAITAKGVHIVTLSPAQRERFRRATRQVYALTHHLFTPGLLSEMRSNRVATTPRL